MPKGGRCTCLGRWALWISRRLGWGVPAPAGWRRRVLPPLSTGELCPSVSVRVVSLDHDVKSSARGFGQFVTARRSVVSVNVTPRGRR